MILETGLKVNHLTSTFCQTSTGIQRINISSLGHYPYPLLINVFSVVNDLLNSDVRTGRTSDLRKYSAAGTIALTRPIRSAPFALNGADRADLFAACWLITSSAFAATLFSQRPVVSAPPVISPRGHHEHIPACHGWMTGRWR